MSKMIEEISRILKPAINCDAPYAKFMIAEIAKLVESEIIRKHEQPVSGGGDAMREFIEDFLSYANNSDGIAGWHKNGEIATWRELDLIDNAQAALAQPIKTEGVNQKLDMPLPQFIEKLYDVLCRRFPMCRACADDGPICGGTGLPCDLKKHFEALTEANTPAMTMADFYYDVDNWEHTSSDRSLIEDSLNYAQVVEIGRLKKLPSVFVASFYNENDDEYTIKEFATREAAITALSEAGVLNVRKE